MAERSGGGLELIEKGFDAVEDTIETEPGENDSEIELYRCTECGAVDPTLGGIHGHIESHRPLRHFYRIGDVEWLNERTERIVVTEYRTELVE